MRALFICVLMLGLTAGCSTERVTPASVDAVAGPVASARVRSPDGARHASPDLAAPTRQGELLSYAQTRSVKRNGAYTAYPVSLSEEHALQAILSGELAVQAPDGELIRLAFDRYVDHRDGNWTWIGRDTNGVDAVLTFGEKAVFGSIPQSGRDPLRLTIRAGQSYLVATDSSKVSGNLATPRRRASDTLVPAASLSSDAGHSNSGAQTSAPGESASMAGSSGLVDVLLGYTNGFAAQLGGTSQAVTRLTNMVEITNQAYVNSGVSMRVRLVKTLQVNYPDNTDNGDALEKLTGYKSGSGSITPDPAFNALRSARDANGADLVSLVRAFRTPENDGCGIAWAIGGSQSAFTVGSAPFGYSVVSDGTDFDEGDSKNYFCRDETLAHEFGHNMGQAHNSEIASSPGVHAYSYGYREMSTSGFYTVMAYRLADSSQFSIRNFANPAVTYSDRPTGVANISDNVRSMNQTMPVVSGFRATVVPDVRQTGNDTDADGKSDIVWWQPGSLAYSLMNGPNITSSSFFSLSSSYTVAATGDYNGDGRADILWTSPARDMYMWMSTGTVFNPPQSVGNYGPGWQIVNQGGDINGDGISDILWWQPGNLSYSLMNGPTITSSSFFTLSSSYTVAATGDYNGDGRTDILWTSPARDMYIWMSTGTGFSAPQSVGNYGPGWEIVNQDGDINGDGKSDILWWQPGNLAYSLMNGPTITSSSFFTLSSSYTIAATGDYNGDGRADILWTSPARDVYTWMSTGAGFSPPQKVGDYGPGWTIIH